VSSRVFFSFVGLTFQFDCRDNVTEFLISKNFGNKHSGGGADGPIYYLEKTKDGFLIGDSQGRVQLAATDGDFLYAVEERVTIEAQLRRHDLYFVHAGVVQSRGGAVLLSGESGAGKSILTLALLHHGFEYLSDELAPIDLDGLRVHPYPHAICLKTEPPGPYLLPKGTFRTSRAFHVPVESLPNSGCQEKQPVHFLLFVRYDPVESDASIVPISTMEGAARLYSNTLNSLAHVGLGLEQAISIAKNCECFTVRSPSAERTCLALQEIISL
jgi:hypothetical protein